MHQVLQNADFGFTDAKSGCRFEARLRWMLPASEPMTMERSSNEGTVFNDKLAMNRQTKSVESVSSRVAVPWMGIWYPYQGVRFRFTHCRGNGVRRMSYQVLARKWRPRDFTQMVGQGHVLRALINALDKDKLHHAFLFTGTRGVGKTTVARILAKCLNCEKGVSSTPCGDCTACRAVDEGRFVDLIEVDAASKAKVDETRDLMDNAQFLPAQGRYKVYLIDEVHMFSGHSFNALLKTLEEPPPHVKFLLATTEPKKLPITVLSRCLQFNLKRLPVNEIAGQLDHILKAEGISPEAGATRLVSVAADGSMRDALSLLEQAISYCDGALAASDVKAMLGTVDRTHIRAILKALAEGDGKALMDRIAAMGEEVADFDDALRELLGMLQRIAIVQVVPDAPRDLDPDGEDITALAGEMDPEDVQLYYQIGLMGRRDLPLAPDPKSGFEMTVLRMLAFRPEDAEVTVPDRERGTTNDKGKERSNPDPANKTTAKALSSAADETRTTALPFPASPEDWPRIVAGLGLIGMAKELAGNCTLAECKGNLVRLYISSGFRQLARENAREKVERSLCTYWGKDIRLRIEVATTDNAQTPESIRQGIANERQRTAERAIDEDPNVRALRTVFDAKIEEVAARNHD
uniref:DNA polymerase III subunit gamma/tau n=1 Tax=Candidatus Kentrum sp. LFY TaxID=2126342 RepID=A0A450UCA4_9GAMM|nr:MAG: DNA polymerase-3 subunit gamma/tau [Candidatus Kentron sp. LFY]